VSVGTVSDIVITWANYLYTLLGCLPVWPSKEKVKQHLPESFKGRYESVRGILDCIELKCELPKDYQKHSEMYRQVKTNDIISRRFGNLMTPLSRVLLVYLSTTRVTLTTGTNRAY